MNIKDSVITVAAFTQDICIILEKCSHKIYGCDVQQLTKLKTSLIMVEYCILL